MKIAEYKIIVSDKGFDDFEAKVSAKLNEGWKPVGGIAFNHSYPHQAMARVVDVTTKSEVEVKTQKERDRPRSLTANEAMKRLDDLT
jgi:hypothetical protein